MMPRTIQVPSEDFKPNSALVKKDDNQSDDMEIDENHDFNAAKARTLAEFYPSSLRATKDLEKRTYPTEEMLKSEHDIESIHTYQGTQKLSDEERLSNFRTKCKIDMLQNKLKPYDLRTLQIPEEVSEYADQVLDHMHNSEDKFLPNYGYMRSQSDVNEKMRAILIDWLIEVHFKFKLLPETLFISVNLIDRYLEAKEIERQRLQLLGVTAMWIACKYEEIYAPEIKDFVYITDNAYDQKDILDLEYEVLRTLEFNVTTPSTYRFLQRYAKIMGADDRAFHLAWYLIELPLIEYKMLKYKPSLISSAALFVAFKILKKEVRWNERMKSITNYSENGIRPCAKDL